MVKKSLVLDLGFFLKPDYGLGFGINLFPIKKSRPIACSFCSFGSCSLVEQTITKLTITLTLLS